MAITAQYINIEPGGYPSVHDNLWVMATSDISSNSNFKYVIDVYDTNGIQLIRARVYPDINSRACYFDIASVLRNLMSFNWFYQMYNDIGTVHCRELDENNGEAAAQFTVWFGEEYLSGIDFINDFQQTSISERAWNFIPPIFGRMLAGSGLDIYLGKFATVRPKRAKYIKGRIDPLFIGMFSYIDTVVLKVYVYNSAGTEIVSDDTSLNFTKITLQQLNISPKAINATFGSTLIDVNVAAYYKVSFEHFGEKDEIIVDIICPKQDIEPIHVHFMNSKGVFETAIFDMTSKTFAQISRKGYIKKEVQFGTLDEPFVLDFYAGASSANKVQYERKANFDTAVDYSMKIQSDFLTDNEFEWLHDLVVSPQVFISNDVGAGFNGCSFYPVTIKADNYEYFKRNYAKLKTLELEIELNQPRNFYRR